MATSIAVCGSVQVTEGCMDTPDGSEHKKTRVLLQVGMLEKASLEFNTIQTFSSYLFSEKC